MSLGETVVYVGAERRKRKLAFQIPFRAGDFSAAETSAALDLNSLGSGLHRAEDRLLHGAAEADSALQRGGYAFCNYLRLNIRILHFLNVYHYPVAGHSLKFFTNCLYFSTLLANYNTRPGGPNCETHNVSDTLNLHTADAGLSPALLNPLSELEIFVKEFGILFAVSVPTGLPIVDDAESISYRVNLLTHCFTPPYFSHTTTVMWHV